MKKQMTTSSKWTLFWDMHSGGTLKEPWEKIYIEAEQDKAIEFFKKRFGHDPYDVACPCCGRNYIVDEYDTLEEASKYQGKKKVLIIREEEVIQCL